MSTPRIIKVFTSPFDHLLISFSQSLSELPVAVELIFGSADSGLGNIPPFALIELVRILLDAK